jgi:GNAT superfamily N-acetyltransferase
LISNLKNAATRIRAAYDNEATELSAVAYESKAYWAYSASQLAAWRDDLTISPDTIASSLVYVAEIDATIAGFYVLQSSTENWILEHFWVLPSYIGRGVGRALLAHATGVAADGGAQAISIDADPHAEEFYAGFGARRIAVIPAPLQDAPDRVRPQMLLLVKAELN